MYSLRNDNSDDGDAIAYTLKAGDDFDLFSIDAGTGAVSFKTIPDFENPPVDEDNIHFFSCCRVE